MKKLIRIDLNRILPSVQNHKCSALGTPRMWNEAGRNRFYNSSCDADKICQENQMTLFMNIDTIPRISITKQ